MSLNRRRSCHSTGPGKSIRGLCLSTLAGLLLLPAGSVAAQTDQPNSPRTRSEQAKAVAGGEATHESGRSPTRLGGTTLVTQPPAASASRPAPGGELGVVPPGEIAAVSRLSGESIFGGEESLPRANDVGRISLPPIRVVTTATDRIGNGSLPTPFSGPDADPGAPLAEQPETRDASWNWSIYQFSAANTFSHPLYFEDVMLERHGHERFPMLQPLVSGGRFVATVPMLPYLMTVRNPCSFEYKLGHYRAGDRVYPFVQRPPYVRKAAVVEALSIAGGAVAVP